MSGPALPPELLAVLGPGAQAWVLHAVNTARTSLQLLREVHASAMKGFIASGDKEPPTLEEFCGSLAHYRFVCMRVQSPRFSRREAGEPAPEGHHDDVKAFSELERHTKDRVAQVRSGD